MDLAEKTVGQAKLEAAVGAQIHCPRTKRVLDVRTSVLTQIFWSSGRVSDVVVDASAWPNMETQLPSLRKLSLVREVNVYDGRILFN